MWQTTHSVTRPPPFLGPSALVSQRDSGGGLDYLVSISAGTEEGVVPLRVARLVKERLCNGQARFPVAVIGLGVLFEMYVFF